MVVGTLSPAMATVPPIQGGLLCYQPLVPIVGCHSERPTADASLPIRGGIILFDPAESLVINGTCGTHVWLRAWVAASVWAWMPVPLARCACGVLTLRWPQGRRGSRFTMSRASRCNSR